MPQPLKQSQVAWDVHLLGKQIETVYYDPHWDVDDIWRDLIENKGYDRHISVLKASTRPRSVPYKGYTIKYNPAWGRWNIIPTPPEGGANDDYATVEDAKRDIDGYNRSTPQRPSQVKYLCPKCRRIVKGAPGGAVCKVCDVPMTTYLQDGSNIILVGQAYGDYQVGDIVKPLFSTKVLLAARTDGTVIVHDLGGGVKPLFYMEDAAISFERPLAKSLLKGVEMEVIVTTRERQLRTPPVTTPIQILTLLFTNIVATQGFPTNAHPVCCGKDMKAYSTSISHTAYVCIECGKAVQKKGGWGTAELMKDGFENPYPLMPEVQ